MRAAVLTALCCASLAVGDGARAGSDSEPALVDLDALEALDRLENDEPEPGAREAGASSHREIEAALEREEAERAEREKVDARIRGALEEQLRLQSQLLERSKNEVAAAPANAELLSDTSTRAAPGPPEERELPAAIFDSQETSIPPGTWGNPTRLKVVQQTLDADGDGVPELTRWIDRESKFRIRQEEDRNYDGVIDTWSDYQWGEIVARVLDSNDDGNPDVWELYRDRRMTSREIDRDDDGVRDAFYTYEDGSLTEERHDSNNDGQIDLIMVYENRVRVSGEEDRDLDGRMDTWTTYVDVGGREVVSRIERDERGEGSITAVEVFDTESGQAVIARKDEDVNGDGEIDVVSIYEQGKLVRREISDPGLVEL